MLSELFVWEYAVQWFCAQKNNLLKESLIRRDGYDYDGTISWLENAEKENTRHKFQAILAQDNPRRHNLVLKSEWLEENSLWEMDDQTYCRRVSNDMAQLLRPILTNCSEIHFVDPHFGPENARFRRPMEAFLRIINETGSYRPEIKSIVIHTASQSDFKFFKQECEQQLCKKTPTGINITLFRWKQRENGEKLHSRLILTDIGGIKVDPGLDDGNPGESFEVFLLKRKFYLKHWADYVTNPAFDKLDDSFEITGKASN